MTFEFDAEAKAEFFDAIAFYESSSKGVGEDFSREVMAAVSQVVAHPEMWPCLRAHAVRRCLLHRFPYALVYSVEPRRVYILAVMHLHRNPNYWRHRVPQ